MLFLMLKSLLSFASCTSPIMHLICPPKFCKTFVFHFPWVLQPSQEKLKTMLIRKFGRLIRCIMGDVQVANEEDENNDVSKDSLTD